MKTKQFKKYVTKNALPLIIGGVVVVAGAAGAYFYANNQGAKLFSNNNSTTQNQAQPKDQTPAQTKGDNVGTGETTSPTNSTPVNTTSIGDVSLQITIDDPSVRTTASVYFYGPAGTYGVEKLVNGSWSTVVSSFSYSGSGGYKFDTMSSSVAETHYRVFSLSENTRTATSGDTIVEWSLVNENGIYTIPIAR